jgi:hypothetical protein
MSEAEALIRELRSALAIRVDDDPEDEDVIDLIAHADDWLKRNRTEKAPSSLWMNMIKGST